MCIFSQESEITSIGLLCKSAGWEMGIKHCDVRSKICLQLDTWSIIIIHITIIVGVFCVLQKMINISGYIIYFIHYDYLKPIFVQMLEENVEIHLTYLSAVPFFLGWCGDKAKYIIIETIARAIVHEY